MHFVVGVCVDFEVCLDYQELLCISSKSLLALQKVSQEQGDNEFRVSIIILLFFVQKAELMQIVSHTLECLVVLQMRGQFEFVIGGQWVGQTQVEQILQGDDDRREASLCHLVGLASPQLFYIVQ